MSTPAAVPTKPAQKHTPYINNPFFVAVEGLKLFFAKAVGVAVILIIVSALSHTNAIFTTPSPAQQTTQNTSSQFHPPQADISPNTVAVVVVLAVVIGAAVVIALLAAGTILTGITAYSNAQLANGKDAPLKEAWRATLNRFWSLLWLQTLTVLKVIAWSLLFIIPGIVMAFRYSLASTAFFDKGLKGNAAIKESLALTKGSWITLFGAQTLFGLITFGTLNSLVSAGTTAVLYRQFRDTPLVKRPKAHGLSIAVFVLAIVAVVVGVVAAIVVASYVSLHSGSTTY
jgi:hypothetical protein